MRRRRRRKEQEEEDDDDDGSQHYRAQVTHISHQDPRAIRAAPSRPKIYLLFLSLLRQDVGVGGVHPRPEGEGKFGQRLVVVGGEVDIGVGARRTCRRGSGARQLMSGAESGDHLRF